MTTKLSEDAAAALKEFERAVRDHEMRGVGPPEEIAEAKLRYQSALRELKALLPKRDVN